MRGTVRHLTWCQSLSLVIVICVTLCNGQQSVSAYPAGVGIPSNLEVKAVSLRVLQDKLRSCQRGGSCPKELLHLAGLKRVTGYAVDKDSRDLILIGHAESGRPNAPLPPLHLEDFVVALRSAWHKYDVVQNNTAYYSPPGCTIDPQPTVLQRLQGIGQHLARRSSDLAKSIQDWRDVCQSPQQVQVFGLPFDSHFAHVLVMADYHMKQVVDGTDTLTLPAFTSLMDMTLEQAKNDMAQGKAVAAQLTSMNRFWFFPGEQWYEEAAGIVWIRRAPVTLLTEEESLDRRGQRRSTGRPDLLAQQFAEKFTVRYQEVAAQHPIYAELENLFRFVTLAQVIKLQAPHTEAGLNLTYLLDEYTVVPTSVPRQLPGRFAVKNFEQRRDAGTASIHLPSCGGVSIDVRPKREQLRSNTVGNLAEQRQAVLRSRPAPDALTWKVSEAGASTSQRVREIRQANKDIAFYTIKDKLSKYEVYGEHDTPIYVGNSIPELLGNVHRDVAQNPQKVVYFDMLNFASNDKIEGFATMLRIQQSRLKLDYDIYTHTRDLDGTEAQNLLFMPGIVLEGKNIQLDSLNGSYSAKIELSIRMKAKESVKKITFNIYAASKHMIQEFIEMIMHFFSKNHTMETTSLISMFNKARYDLEKKYGQKILIQYEDERRNIYIVDIPMTHTRAHR